MGVYIKGVTVEKLVKALICSTEFMPDGFEIVQTHDVSDTNVGDMISRQDAIKAVARAIWHYPKPSLLNNYHFAYELAEDALKCLPSAEPEPTKNIIQKFHDFQIEWLTSHHDLTLEPNLEMWIVRFLHDTANCYMMEDEECLGEGTDCQDKETEEPGHIRCGLTGIVGDYLVRIQDVIAITEETGALETQRRVKELKPFIQPKRKTGKWMATEKGIQPVKPVFSKNEKEKRDAELWTAITTAVRVCGLSGEDVTAMGLETLRQLGRYDLLPPCEQRR